MPQSSPVLVAITVRLEWVNRSDPQQVSYVNLFQVIKAPKIANSDVEFLEQERPLTAKRLAMMLFVCRPQNLGVQS